MKKLCSILCIVAMMVSMLAVMVFPVAAAEPATKATASYVSTLVNKFDMSASRMGTINQGDKADGSVTNSNTRFYSSDAVAVKEGDVVMFGPTRMSQGYQLVGLDADKKVVKSAELSSAMVTAESSANLAYKYLDDINGNMVFCTYTVPAGVSYVRTTVEALYARSYLMTVNQNFTLQQWKDWVAYTYPAQEFKNLGVSTTFGRYDASSTTPKSTTEYYAPALISVEQNDVIYYGPANLEQGYQLAFYPSGSATGKTVGNGFSSTAMGTLTGNDGTRYYTGGTVTTSKYADGSATTSSEAYNTDNGTLKVVETFDNGQVIYAWRAKAAGQVGLVIPKAPSGNTAKDYSTMFLATKNQPFSEQSYYNYWDNQPNANLYNATLDLNAGHYNANGTWSTQNSHRSSHSIAVQPGEVIEMGPCYDKEASYLVVVYDANRQNGDIIKQTNAAFQSLGTTTATGTTDSSGGAGLMLRFTVPENVYYINLILRTGQYGTYTAKRIGNLTDSDNLFDAENAIMGRWHGDGEDVNASYTSGNKEFYKNTEYYATEEIAVSKGETIFFGPAQKTQSYQLVFKNSQGTTTTVGTSASGALGTLEVFDTFESNTLTSTGGTVIFKYTAGADGTIGITVRAEWKDEFVVTRGKPFSARQFNFYQDNKEGANLYNIALDPTTGGIKNTGLFNVTPSTFYSTHMIDVVPGETLTFGPVDLGQGYQLCGWNMLGALTADSKKGTDVGVDLTGVYQGKTIGNAIAAGYTYGFMTYTVPANVNKLSIVVRQEVKDRFMVVRDPAVANMTPAQIEDYYYNYVGIKKNSPLKGKTALFVGDSISQAAKDNAWAKNNLYPVTSGSNGSWSGRIHRNYLLKSVTNNSVSGASLSSARDSGAGRITTQLKKAAGQDFDYVVLHGGVNDAWESYPLGSYDPNNFDPSTFDNDTYAGGLETTIHTAIELFGDTAAITYIMNFYAPNKAAGTVSNMSAYFALAKEICAKWGITYLDLYNNAEVTEKMMSTTKASPYFPDDIHPNEMGYAVLWSYIGDHMETITPYSSGSNTSWEKLADSMIEEFKELNAKFFTNASMEAAAAAIEAAKALSDYEKYAAVIAASDLLVQGGTAIPITYYNSGNFFYQRMFTKQGHFSVSSASDLQLLQGIVASGALGAGAVIEQTKDIDLTGYNNLRIGSEGVPFAATYNGNNHKLLNYTVNDGLNYVALFPVLSGTIKNLVVEKANMKISAWSAVLVGRGKNNSVIENVHIRQATLDKVNSPNNQTNNSASIMLSAAFDSSCKVTLRNCTVSGCTFKINQKTGNIGFLVAKDNSGSLVFENCHAFGNTLKYNAEVFAQMGGIVGEVYGNNDSLTNCSAFNNTYLGTSGFTATGGLIGIGSSATVTNCGTNNNGMVAGSGTSQTNTALYTTAASVANNLYNGNTAVDVAAGETIFFGPVDPDQDVLGTFGGTQITKANAVPVDAFMGGQVLYSYKAAAAGAFLATVGEEYKDMYLVTKAAAANQVISAQLYHNYFDSQPNANLYNVLLDLSPGYINAPGDHGTTTTHSNSHYIKVTPGETITFGPSVSGQGFHGKTFDANFNALAQIKAANMTTSGTLTTVDNPAVDDALDSDMVFYKYTVPEGVSYITLINWSTVRSMFVALRSATGLTPASYYEYLGVDESNPLNGKSALFVGDSISRGARDPNHPIGGSAVLGWAGRIGIANNMDWANYSVSSTSLSTVRPQGRILDQLVRANTGKDYDYVVIQGGVNDAWGADGVENPAPVGTVSSSFDPASFDKYTYAGGLEETLYTAVKLYGDTARIIYVLNYKAPNCANGTVGNMASYFDMGKQICEKWGVEVCDLYNQFTFDNYVYTTDLIHANYMGYDLIAPVIEDSMKNAPLYAESEVDGIAEIAEELTVHADEVDESFFTPASVTAFKQAIANVNAPKTRQVSTASVDTIAALEAAADLLVVQDNKVVPMSLLTDGNIYHESVADQVEETTVATGYEFKALADLINAGTMTKSVKVTQIADIDLADYSDTRIGVSTSIPFAGIYDGGNKTISNVTITGALDNTALFPYLSGTIKNLKIDQADVSANGWSAIVVAKVIGSASLIDGVHVTNSTITKAGTKNGLAVIVCQGNSAGDKVTVKNCSVSGVTAQTTATGMRGNFGWIVSRGQSGGLVMENCYAYGNTMNMLFNTYGLVAEAETATIKNCGSFNNTLLVEPTQPAGIVSHIQNGTLTVENCYSDLEKLYFLNNQYKATDAVLNGTNNYMGQSLADIQSGKLAYTLKTTTATEETWVQTTHPKVDEEGSEVVKVTYVVDSETVKTTYTNSTGAIIDPAADPEKADYLFKGWDEAVAGNGDITYTAHFVYTVAAAEAEALINAIGTVTADSGSAIDAARSAYTALSDEEKELVTNLATLTAAEAAYAAIMELKAAAEAVDALIAAIGTVTADSGDAIEAARNAYEALSEEEKVYVTKYTTLTEAEAAYIAIGDNAAADEVEALIAAIGTVTLESDTAIYQARRAYKKLTDVQKALVANYQVLLDAEAALEALLASNKASMELSLIANSIVNPNGNLGVAVKLTNNPGIIALSVNIGYDAEIYTYAGITPAEGPAMEETLFIAPDAENPDPTDFVVDDNGITWITLSMITTADAGFTGEELMNVNFTVAEDVGEATVSTIQAKVSKDGVVDTTGKKFVDVTTNDVDVLIADLILGDVDGNDDVNLRDVVIMLRYTVSKSEVVAKFESGEYDINAFDADGNGTPGINDVLLILKMVNDRANDKVSGRA